MTIGLYLARRNRYNQVATIKTAVSLQNLWFEQVNSLAHEMKISRSRLFVIALEDYIRAIKTDSCWKASIAPIKILPMLNLRRAQAPGNVLLDTKEAGLPKQSVVVVTQVLLRAN